MDIEITYLNHARANILNRLVAKAIDLIIAAAFSKILSPVGIMAGFIYLLISDGLFDGRSIGKKIIHLKALQGNGRGCSFRESILRNITIAGAYICFFIPYVGWLLSGAILAVELLAILGNERGARIGDELAGTYVIENGGT